MATSKKKKFRATRWYDGDTAFDELDPSEQIAHQIVDQFRDLAPSVERIMAADLTAPERQQAIGLFQAALDDLDDPNRDPRHAIDTARTAGAERGTAR
jgi:truncated hemoglobin YjbI